MSLSEISSSHSTAEAPIQNDLVLSKRDLCEIITTFATAILLIGCIANVIYYTIWPVKPMIPLFANFTLSLPVVIYGSLGVVLTLVFVVQLCRVQEVALSIRRGQHTLIRSIVHVGGRSARSASADAIQKFQEDHQDEIKFVEEEIGKNINFTTRDNVKLSGYWHFADKDAPTAILFHGNAGNATQMYEWAAFYKNNRCNVLMVEYRGYGLSEGEACGANQELEAYLDGEANLKFVLFSGIAKKNVILHGFSLGSAVAAALGYFYDLDQVVLDHPFTNLADVYKNKFSYLDWDEIVPAAYARQSKESDPEIPNGKKLVPDGFNTLKKIKKMRGEVFVVSGKEDKLTPPELGKRLVEARYPNNEAEQRSHYALLEGGHSGHGLFDDKAGKALFCQFLCDRFPEFFTLNESGAS